MNTTCMSASAVDILLIGNVTRDLVDERDFGRYRLGGTVTFAAVVADRLGRRPTVLTRATPETDLSAFPASTQLIVLPTATTTTFANLYTPQGRVQYCYTPAPPIGVDDISSDLRHPDMVLLGPIANEIEGEVATIFQLKRWWPRFPRGGCVVGMGMAGSMLGIGKTLGRFCPIWMY